jgi:hypothetical protein
LNAQSQIQFKLGGSALYERDKGLGLAAALLSGMERGRKYIGPNIVPPDLAARRRGLETQRTLQIAVAVFFEW